MTVWNFLQTVVVPEVGGPSGPVDGIMTKNITIPADSTLEVSISMQLKCNIMVHPIFALGPVYQINLLLCFRLYRSLTRIPNP